MTVPEEPDPGAGAPAQVSLERKEEERKTRENGQRGKDKTRSELARVRPGYQQENKAADCYQRGDMYLIYRKGKGTFPKVNPPMLYGVEAPLNGVS